MERLNLEEAVEKMLHYPIQRQTEVVRLEDSLKRQLSEDVYAKVDYPPFSRSPLDGYAIKSKTTKEGINRMPVAETICAGDVQKSYDHQEVAIRIMTGAKMPEGYDAVIKQELVTVENQNGIQYMSFEGQLKAYENYIFQGEDIKKGECIVKKDTIVEPSHIGVLASVGVHSLTVYKPLRVGLLCTGSELQDVGKPLEDGKIYDSNKYLLESRFKTLGFEVIAIRSEEDVPEKVAQAIDQHIDVVDILITTGGVSVGIKDIMHDVVKTLPLDQLFWKIDIKPGTPVMASIYKETPVISLSGNPFGAYAVFETFVRSYIGQSLNHEYLKLKKVQAQITDDFGKSSGTRRLLRGYFDGKQVHLPKSNHSSGALYALTQSNCFIDIPKGSNPIKKGDIVEIVY